MILIRATQLVLLCHPLSFPEASPETLCSSASVPESEACWLGKICVLFPTRDSNGTRAREGGGVGESERLWVHQGNQATNRQGQSSLRWR